MKTGLALVVALAANGLAATAAPAAAPLEDYGKLPAVELVELSPDGSRLAYVGAVNGERSIVVIVVGGQILAATPIKDQAADAIQWAGDGIVILRSHRSIKGLTNLAVGIEKDSWLFEPSTVQEITAIDLNHRSSQSLISTPKQRYFPMDGPLQVRLIGGRWYAFLSGIPTRPADTRDNPPSDLFRVDLETGEPTKVAGLVGKSVHWVVGPDGAVVAWSSIDGNAGPWSVHAPGHDKALADGEKAIDDRFGWVYSLGNTPDTVVFNEKIGLADNLSMVKLDGSGMSPLQDQPFVQRLWLDPKSGQLTGYTSGADEMKVTLFDPKAQAKVNAAYKAFPGLSVQLMSASADFGRMVVQSRGKDDAGTFWLVDLSTGKATPLGSSAPVAGADAAVVSTFDYKSADGLSLQGVVTMPPGGAGKNLPVVVMPTGAGSLRARTEFDWWAQAFAARGYVVFQPNPRGVVGLGKAFHEAGQGELTRKTLSDITDGVRALAAAGVIDPSRLCLVGEDMGGYSALAVVAMQKFPARCVVSFAAPTDLNKILIGRYWQLMISRVRPNLYTGSSPVNYADYGPAKFTSDIKSPVMIIHPKDDANVPASLSRSFVETLKKAGKPAELVELDGSDHFLLDSQTRVATLKASVAFVERNNPAK